jgi:hypothetical protein
VDSGFLCLVYWICRQAEFTIDYYTRNLTVLHFAYSLVITLKTFTINHNTQSRCNTLCTVLILHQVILCILTCTLLCASLIYFELNWPTCTLLVLYWYSTTGAALPLVSPINGGIWHAENAAPCTVARDVTEVTWSLPTVALNPLPHSLPLFTSLSTGREYRE